MKSFKIIKIKKNNRESAEDIVVEEVPLTLIIDGKELVTLLCMPADLEDLVRGFLFTSGLIGNIQEIEKIIIDQQCQFAYIDLLDDSITKDLIFKRVYTSGCGREALFYDASDLVRKFKVISEFSIKAKKINEFVANFHRMSQVYLKTGGAHSAALADKNSILIFKEDIGRHNAIDKVVGNRLKQGGSFEDMLLITSGRISSEVILKAQKCGIPIVVSRSASTNEAIKLARQIGITLVAFARGNRMNVYSNEERII